ncbi:MAG TPA: glycoside hydrolase family 6 protein [Solirubrobacteraceae bacterium]|nr:glycoside hydrolase family 6 protein [Solirubrobacteraceae bacterium]
MHFVNPETRRPVRARLLAVALVAAAGLTTFAAISLSSAAPARSAVPHAGQACPQPSSSTRQAGNPLGLATAPGADPLNGANFFVPGPAKGPAAGAIAQLVGLNPANMPVDESWADFEQSLGRGAIGAKLAHNPSLARKVADLSKIAAEPDVQRVSIYSEGGGPGAIFAQTEKVICSNIAADPGSIMAFNTYFLHPTLGGCADAAQINHYMPTFKRQITEMAAAIDRRPALILAEIDALGSSACIARHGGLPAWEAALKYEVDTFEALPHTAVYVEGGYSDSNSVGYTAKALNAIGVDKIQGFFTNDTHNQWTINEIRWATKVAKRTHGAHFIVNTSSNGQGPKLNPHPTTQGVEDLCNPPGRGLGPKFNTDTGYQFADAFMWTHPPGNSSGCGGGPPGGVFYPAYAEGLGQRANQKLGPGFPSRPY